MRRRIAIALAVLVLGCGTSSNQPDAGDAGLHATSDAIDASRIRYARRL